MEKDFKQSSENFLKAFDAYHSVVSKIHANERYDSVSESTFSIAKKQLSRLKMIFISKWLPYLLTFFKPQKP